jgi:hypothetical protein
MVAMSPSLFPFAVGVLASSTSFSNLHAAQDLFTYGALTYAAVCGDIKLPQIFRIPQSLLSFLSHIRNCESRVAANLIPNRVEDLNYKIIFRINGPAIRKKQVSISSIRTDSGSRRHRDTVSAHVSANRGPKFSHEHERVEISGYTPMIGDLTI